MIWFTDSPVDFLDRYRSWSSNRPRHRCRDCNIYVLESDFLGSGRNGWSRLRACVLPLPIAPPKDSHS